MDPWSKNENAVHEPLLERFMDGVRQRIAPFSLLEATVGADLEVVHGLEIVRGE
jgi:hypothetical protein